MGGSLSRAHGATSREAACDRMHTSTKRRVLVHTDMDEEAWKEERSEDGVWRAERKGREKDGEVKREHGVGKRKQTHTGRKAHKRGVQRDKEGMIGRGVKSEGWCPRPLHTGGPGLLRAISRLIARTPLAGDLVPNLRGVGIGLRIRTSPPRDARAHRSARRNGCVDRPGRDAMERMGGRKKRIYVRTAEADNLEGRGRLVNTMLKKHNWPYNKLRGYMLDNADTESRNITQPTYINAPLFETFLSSSSDPTADPDTIAPPDAVVERENIQSETLKGIAMLEKGDNT
ncbi:hypothetical protein B0H13DRAFT_2285783 [Mycena leptocephala]|nr:hypothetical protein B0H13DRAFT_2285783 [Mycena leptocephala]